MTDKEIKTLARVHSLLFKAGHPGTHDAEAEASAAWAVKKLRELYAQKVFEGVDTSSGGGSFAPLDTLYGVLRSRTDVVLAISDLVTSKNSLQMIVDTREHNHRQEIESLKRTLAATRAALTKKEKEITRLATRCNELVLQCEALKLENESLISKEAAPVADTFRVDSLIQQVVAIVQKPGKWTGANIGKAMRMHATAAERGRVAHALRKAMERGILARDEKKIYRVA